MIYLKNILHKYQLFLFLPLILTSHLYISQSEFNFLLIFKYILFLLFFSFSLITYRKLYRIKQYEPLKQYLNNINIESSLDKSNQLTLSIIFSLDVLLFIYLWLDLSIYGGFKFFINTLIAIITSLSFFYDKIRLYDKYLNILFIILFAIIFNIICINYLFDFTYSIHNYFDFFILSFSIISLILFDDMRKFYLDYQIDKNTIVRKIGQNNTKMIIIFLGILIYASLILKTIFAYSPFYLIPFFSIPIYINVLLRIQKLDIKEYFNINFLFTSFIIFHTILISISNFMTLKFEF